MSAITVGAARAAAGEEKPTAIATKTKDKTVQNLLTQTLPILEEKCLIIMNDFSKI
ncbi:MAG: hypothetical protein ACLFV6_01040 [Spirulinaceae cyanobacterium]